MTHKVSLNPVGRAEKKQFDEGEFKKQIGIILIIPADDFISIIPIRFLTLPPGKRFSEGIPFFYFLDFCGGYK